MTRPWTIDIGRWSMTTSHYWLQATQPEFHVQRVTFNSGVRSPSASHEGSRPSGSYTGATSVASNVPPHRTRVSQSPGEPSQPSHGESRDRKQTSVARRRDDRGTVLPSAVPEALRNNPRHARKRFNENRGVISMVSADPIGLM